MIEPPELLDESNRINALHSLEILDTPQDESFDRITRLAQLVLKVPITFISLVDTDRQWLKSRQGLELNEIRRRISFCAHAIAHEENNDSTSNIFEVQDTMLDLRFYDNPLVTGDLNIRFYAGYVLKAPDGSKLGTLSIMDHKPHTLSDDDRKILQDLGSIIEEKFDVLSYITKDPVTGLLNRRGFTNKCNKLIQRMADKDNKISFAYFHLKKLKPRSNVFKDSKEKQQLIEFSKLLRNTFSNFEIVSRIGIDQFCAFNSSYDSDDFLLSLSKFKEIVSHRNTKHNKSEEIKYYAGWLIEKVEKCENALMLIHLMENRVNNLKFDPHQTLA